MTPGTVVSTTAPPGSDRTDESDLGRREGRLPPLLSVIAGMVDVIGYLGCACGSSGGRRAGLGA